MTLLDRPKSLSELMEIRRRLRNPPNAVPDKGEISITLKRPVLPQPERPLLVDAQPEPVPPAPEPVPEPLPVEVPQTNHLDDIETTPHEVIEAAAELFLVPMQVLIKDRKRPTTGYRHAAPAEAISKEGVALRPALCTMDQVLESIAKHQYFGLDQMLHAQHASYELLHTRQVAAYLCFKIAHAPIPDIAARFNHPVPTVEGWISKIARKIGDTQVRRPKQGPLHDGKVSTDRHTMTVVARHMSWILEKYEQI